MTRPTYADWRAEKMAEINRLGAAVNWRRDEHPNPPHTPLRGECAPECVEAEPARRGSLPLDPEAPAGPFPTQRAPRTRSVAHPNYQALGLGSAEEAA